MTRKIDSENTSRVSERLAWLRGRRVDVQVDWGDEEGFEGEHFEAVYSDMVSCGEELFFVFSTAGGERLVNASSVVWVNTVGDAEASSEGHS